MKKSLFAAGLALATLIGATANAATISLQTFDINYFNSITANGNVEDFEGYGAIANWIPSTVTRVGTFTSTGGTGTGSVCNAQSGGNCQTLAINASTASGQGNLVPLGGSKALSSNDTFGIFWDVFEAANGHATGGLFSKVVFAVRDAADISDTTFTIKVGDTTTTLTGQSNDNRQLVVIDFGALVSGAQISMFNTKNGNPIANDGFTMDGATTLAPVPLPASALLLLGGFGALGAMRKRKQKNA